MAVILRTAGTMTGTGISSPHFTQLWWTPQTAGGSTADATDCLARFRAFWQAMIAEITAGTVITLDRTCIAIEATTGVLTGSFTGTDPGAVTGTGAGDPMPRQTQGLLRLQTSTIISGRRLQGRLFIPAPVESGGDNGTGPDSGYTTALAAAGGGMLSGGATTSAPVVWHRPQGGAGGSHGVITGVTASSFWAVLRSRRA